GRAPEPGEQPLGDDRLDAEEEQRAEADRRREEDEGGGARPHGPGRAGRDRRCCRRGGQGFNAPASPAGRNGLTRSMGIGKKVVVCRSEATSRIVWRNRSWTAIGVCARTEAAWASFSAAWNSPSALMTLAP